MDAHSQLKALRLQCEHLCTLLDRFRAALPALEQALTMEGTASLVPAAESLNDLGHQSELIAAEALRLPGFVRSFQPKGTDSGRSH